MNTTSSETQGLSLRSYQAAAVEHGLEHPRVLYGCPMGAGKTAIALNLIARLPGRALVVAPYRVATLVWPEEAGKFAPNLTLAVAVGDAGQRIAAFATEAKVTVINFENLVWLFDSPELLEGIDTLVLDESSRLKNPRSKTFKRIRRELARFSRRYWLAGTLLSEGPEDLWGQVCLLDDGKAMGRSFDRFQKEHYIHGREVWDWTPAPGTEEWVAEKSAPLVYTIADAEYRDTLPGLVVNRVPLVMPEGLRERYDTMARDSVLELGEAEIYAGSAGILTGKLRQLGAGFAYRPDGLPHWISPYRAQAAMELLDEVGRAIIVYEFVAELVELRKRHEGPVLGEGVTEAQARKALYAWNQRETRVLYLHPRSGGHGLNLQAGGNHLIWMQPPWSLDLFDQVHARLHRSGQTSTVFAHVLTAEGSLDAHVLRALQGKQDVRTVVEEVLRGQT